MAELTITQHLRAHLLRKAGLVPMPDLETLRKTEWSEEFESLMRNRLIMGAFRYGRLCAPGKLDFDRVRAMRERLQAYRETGNKEFLVDIANMALLEFEEGGDAGTYFRSVDDVKHAEASH